MNLVLPDSSTLVGQQVQGIPLSLPQGSLFSGPGLLQWTSAPNFYVGVSIPTRALMLRRQARYSGAIPQPQLSLLLKVLGSHPCWGCYTNGFTAERHPQPTKDRLRWAGFGLPLEFPGLLLCKRWGFGCAPRPASRDVLEVN